MSIPSLRHVVAIMTALTTAGGCAGPETADDIATVSQALNDGTISPSEIRVGLNYWGGWAWDHYNWKDEACAQFAGREDAWAGVRDFHDWNWESWVKEFQPGTNEHFLYVNSSDGLVRGPISAETYERAWTQLQPAIGYYD